MTKLSEYLKKFEEFCELHGDAYEIDLERVKSLIAEKSKPVFFLKELQSAEQDFNKDEQVYLIDLSEALISDAVNVEVKNHFRNNNATAVKVTVSQFAHDYSVEYLNKAPSLDWFICCHIPDVDIIEEYLFPNVSYKDMSPEVLSWLDAYQEWRSNQYSKYYDYLVQAGGYGYFVQRNLRNFVCQLNLEIGDGGSLYVWLDNGEPKITLQMY